MFGLFPLTPAYGRDYKSKKAVLEAWNENKDFRTASGPYTSKRDFDLDLAHLNSVTLRYNRNTLVVVLKRDKNNEWRNL